MAQDRSLDRHRTTNYPYRPMPPDLLERLDAVVGAGNRSRVLSALLSAFLDGRQMPTVGEVLEELDNSGQGRGA